MSAYWDKFVLFGDSITQFTFEQHLGFSLAAELQNRYVRKFDILNRGFSGYNSEHARQLLPVILNAEHRPGVSEVKLMTIFFGTNDSCSQPHQHVELSRYIENSKYMIEMIKEKGIKPIIIAPCFHDSAMAIERFGFASRVNNNKNMKSYSDALKKLCEEMKVPMVELREELLPITGYTDEQILDEKFDNLSKALVDGIHLTGESLKILYEKLIKTIAINYPELEAESLPLKFAEHRDIDPANIEGTMFKNIELK